MGVEPIRQISWLEILSLVRLPFRQPGIESIDINISPKRWKKRAGALSGRVRIQHSIQHSFVLFLAGKSLLVLVNERKVGKIGKKRSATRRDLFSW